MRISTQRIIVCHCWLFLNLAITAAAFTFTRIKSPSYRRRVTNTRCHADKNSDELLSLMDEAVSLYSILKISNESENDDIVSMRKREVVELVEHTIGVLTNDNDTNNSQSPDNDSQVVMVDGVVDVAAVARLSKELDEAILIDYQPTFSSEEYDEWIKNIEVISSELDKKLRGIDVSSIPLLSAAPITNSHSWNPEGLRERLDQLKTLISPPLATPRHVSGKPVSVQIDPVTTKNDVYGPGPIKSSEIATKDHSAIMAKGQTPTKSSGVVEAVDANNQMVQAESENEISTTEDGNDAAVAVVSIVVVAILGLSLYPDYFKQMLNP